MLAATVELTSHVLTFPDSEHVLTNVKAISSFVRFLKTLKYEKGCDVSRLLDGCIIMEKAAKSAVLGEPNAHVEAIQVSPASIVLVVFANLSQSLLTCSPGNRLLAQALMTNVPKLDTACRARAINVFAQSEQRTSNRPLLAPDCFMPSTYNFGPDPDTTNVVDIMRAVYSDAQA